MAITAEFKSGKIPQGEYNGVISKVEKRDYVSKEGEAYSYLDVYAQLDIAEGQSVQLKCGAPLNITPSSKLGRLVQKFMPDAQQGAQIDLEALLLQKPVKVYVQDVNNDGTIFSEINFETITPR